MKYAALILMSILFSCKSTGKTTNSLNKVSENDFIVLERGACFGTCPIYELTLYANGKINYKGKAYTEYKGFYQGQIETKKAQSLFERIATYNWETYPEQYPIDNVDFPQFKLTYKTAQITKKIQGNSRAAEEIVSLTRTLDSLVLEANLQEKL